VYAETQFAIAAKAEHKCLVHHNFVAGCALQIDVAHGDCDVTMNLDAVLGSVVVVPDLDPALQREACVFRKVRIAADEVGNGTLLSALVLHELGVSPSSSVKVTDKWSTIHLPIDSLWFSWAFIRVPRCLFCNRSASELIWR
jgi:hypothetical protein